MDFGALPPEINSARMYSGPGSGPMFAAAIAWDRLADDLDSTAASYRSVITALTSGPWQGAASTSMAAATPPYLAWMTTTGAQAEQTAAQARAAVTAYETAYAMMVPPPVIAANRAQLMLLMATNVLGQNTPAIAATEAQYGEMWAQDAAAMYGYAGDSAAVATLTPFTPPTEITDSVGLTGQAAAVAQATSTAAADNVESMMLTAPQLTSALQTVLQGLASPVAAMQSASPLSSLSTLNAVVSPISSAMSGLSSSMSSLSSGASIMDSLNPIGNSLGPATSAASNVPALAPAVETSSGAGTLGSAGLSASGGAVSAGTGRAATVGALSVPQTWATATTTTVPTAAAALQGGGYSAAPDVSAGSPTGMLGGMPLTAGARRGPGGATAPRVGVRIVMPPPTAGG